MVHSKLKTFHLFAGAGGGILADLLLGHIPIGACEIESYPRDVLSQRQRDGILPEFPIWDDVRTLDGKPWYGAVDVLCGGFPCQDISSSGTGEGLEGKRSGLWREYKRLIGEMRPKFVFAENSPNLRTKGLVTVVKDLAELGYDARWCVLGSGHLGGAHLRKRMWVLAYPAGLRLQGSREHIKPKLQAPSCDREADWTKLLLQGANEPIDSRKNDAVANWVERNKAIGNGQDPVVAATAWSILMESL